MYDDLRHSAKLHLLQSAVSRLLVDLIFDAYFVGLPPEQAAQLEEVESFLKPFGK
jgi:activating signal cointegrator complex subunit 1